MIKLLNRPRRWQGDPLAPQCQGFSRTDLMVILGVLGLLALVFWPAYAANRSDSQAFQCLNNHRQLAIAWTMYATENSDQLPTMRPVPGTMSWLMSNPDNTNTLLLTVASSQAWAAGYLKSASVWKCPADTVAAPNGPRVRSISFNGPLTGFQVNVQVPSYPPGRQYLSRVDKMSQLLRPAAVLLTVDEYPDSINDSLFMFDPGKVPDLYSWRDVPASYHNGAAGISFADGRADLHRWIDPTTVLPIRRQSKWWGSTLTAPYSPDVQWMNNAMPYR